MYCHLTFNLEVQYRSSPESQSSDSSSCLTKVILARLRIALGRLKLNVCFASTDSGNWMRVRARKHNTTRRNLHKVYLNPKDYKTVIEGLSKEINIVFFFVFFCFLTEFMEIERLS